MTATTTEQPARATDPGFVSAQAQADQAIARLRALGVDAGEAAVIVHRVYSAGRDRGLYLGLRGRHTDN